MSDLAESALPKSAVHCPTCRRFLFNVVVTADAPPVGRFAEISDFRCPKCGAKNFVLLGVADKDRRDDVKKVEEKLREQMAKQTQPQEAV